MSLTIPAILAAALRSAWEHIASAESWWTGARTRSSWRATALMAIADADPLTAVGGDVVDRPFRVPAWRAAATHDMAYRLATPRRHDHPSR